MNKKERVLAAIKGQEVDRIPASFYSNNNIMERNGEYNALYLWEKTLIYDWDFIKTQLSGYYYSQAWGCEFAIEPGIRPDVKVTQTKKVVSTAEEFRKVPYIDPAKNAVFAEQLRLVEILNEAFKGEVPYAQSVFSPLTVADALAGNLCHQKSTPQYMKTLMYENPDALEEGLATVTETLCEYIRQCIRKGAAGIYMATTHWACGDYMTVEEYKKFGLANDLKLLQAARDEGAYLNMFHICRDNCFVEDLCSCEPVDMINYESTSPNNPDIAAIRKLTGKAIWGGVDQRNELLTGTPEEVKEHTRKAIADMDGRGLLIGPGCTCSPYTPPQNYFAVREACDTWKK
ncbi:MAG: hypothetical protein DELT_00595 [Desulfovibrio sp.]